MYNKTCEVQVFKESLRYMVKASEFAHSLHMTDHGPLHAQRVYAICRWLGTLFSLSEYESDLMQAAALLHDIGMVSADRKNHNIESEKLVLSRAQEQILPFTSDEAAIVGKLCRWHRGDDYINNHIEFCEGNKIRVGLLASILRLSDELDLDYRRTSYDSVKDMVITKQYKEDQIQYHKSVLSILGVRIRADKLSKCFELLVDDIGGAKLQIERLIKEILGTPLPFPVKILPTKKILVPSLEVSNYNKKALIYAYCNPHGLLTAVISKICMELNGIHGEIICNKDETANADSFWCKLEDASFAEYELIYFIDLHIDINTINFVKKIITSNTACTVFISGATLASSGLVSRLIEYGATLLLGDEHVLFYSDFLNNKLPFWIKVAGACNVDSHVLQKNTNKEIFEVTSGFKNTLWQYFNDIKDYNIEYIIRMIEFDNKKYFIAESKKFDLAIESVHVETINCGRVLIVKNCNNIPGRFIYDLLINCIQKNKCVVYENFEFKTPYAIYPALRSDGLSMRVLFVSYYKNSNLTLPIRCFCNEENTSVGKDNTIWKNYPNKEEAVDDICKVIESINNEYGVDIEDIPCRSTISTFIQ